MSVVSLAEDIVMPSRLIVLTSFFFSPRESWRFMVSGCMRKESLARQLRVREFFFLLIDAVFYDGWLFISFYRGKQAPKGDGGIRESARMARIIHARGIGLHVGCQTPRDCVSCRR